jgi:DNA-binding MarR family transcriptional regulator
LPETPGILRIVHGDDGAGLVPILALFKHGKPMNMETLVRLTQFDPATARRILHGLEATGILRVRQDRHGGVLISLTAEGRTIGENVHEIDSILRESQRPANECAAEPNRASSD